MPICQPPDWEAAAATLLDRAAAQGRRDGLEGQGEGAAPPRILPLPGLEPGGSGWPGPEALPALLLLGLRQCYAAGHRHGSDVRRENALRRGQAAAAG